MLGHLPLGATRCHHCCHGGHAVAPSERWARRCIVGRQRQDHLLQRFEFGIHLVTILTAEAGCAMEQSNLVERKVGPLLELGLFLSVARSLDPCLDIGLVLLLGAFEEVGPSK